jgi:hypothetical protein
MQSEAMIRDIARQFATGLDRNDFGTVEALLSPGCIYELSPGLLLGPRQIIESYQANDARAQPLFDHIGYQSEVIEVHGESALIKFVDQLEKGGLRYAHACLQRITVSPAGQIERIVQVDSPEEQIALREFFKAVGLIPA